MIQLSYLLITPYAIEKNLIGNIVSRLSLKLPSPIGIMMVNPTQLFAQKYIQFIQETTNKDNIFISKLFINYIKINFVSKNRIMILLFSGKNIKTKVNNVVGHIMNDNNTTIHNSYSSSFYDNHTNIPHTFKPAVITSLLTPGNSIQETQELSLIYNFLFKQPNITTITTAYNKKSLIKDEQSLVIIKPDIWQCPYSTKTGSIIDTITQQNELQLVGCKLHTMSIEEATKFYKPIKIILRKKNQYNTINKIQKIIFDQFNISILKNKLKIIATQINNQYSDRQFQELIMYMTGQTTSTNSYQFNYACMIMVYQGNNAIAKIRTLLGNTNPQIANYGTIRKNFGKNIMQNAIHASDSYNNAIKEMKIIKIQSNTLLKILKQFIN